MKNSALRGFFYFRMGYVTYFVMVVGVINILTSTYFLAVQRIPWIRGVFPTFEIYVASTILVGLPIIIFAGWLHLKRTGTFSAEIRVQNEVHPYNYKLAPGFLKEVYGPAYLAILQLNIKKAKGEKLTEEEILQVKKLEDQLAKLIEGGYAGTPPKGAL
ncbi:MAG: hypothetical protein ACREBU_00370 [Nitrososphaera sp.]